MLRVIVFAILVLLIIGSITTGDVVLFLKTILDAILAVVKAFINLFV